ncbi:hypothetical protein FBY35_6264 [Streptomyces sp. SLBN-118]|nr:hypothetical protein FBY35_6264 [Streptomyces sp. SLBN-118]
MLTPGVRGLLRLARGGLLLGFERAAEARAVHGRVVERLGIPVFDSIKVAELTPTTVQAIERGYTGPGRDPSRAKMEGAAEE